MAESLTLLLVLSRNLHWLTLAITLIILGLLFLGLLSIEFFQNLLIMVLHNGTTLFSYYHCPRR
ncbi:hypothetical protein EBZ02_02975 [bacterium]|nr:hypothetical protein [bacterium]